AGNDFIVIDDCDGRLKRDVRDLSKLTRYLCMRKRSIGSDGLLLIERSDIADIKMRVFNPDGGEVSMCGNGSRCVAYFAVIKGLAPKQLTIETRAGKLNATVVDRAAKIAMTPPRGLRINFYLKVKGKAMRVSFVDTGVPHVVCIEDDIESIDVQGLGREIRRHKIFAPDGTNVNFAQVKDKNTILIRTYERGVEDETLACGTGATASAIVSSALGYVDSPVKVKTHGGDALYIYFAKTGGEYKDVFLEGEVELSYEGSVDYV
ncbi:MAG: diaminopimelate epimerase, partial [Candidatus Omnitrophica bacterium]|nr:diaminopimelate epimerase [Candidatus Omnitrophota bacterium]